MELDNLKHITVGDIIEVSEMMKMSTKNAIPLARKFKDKHHIEHKDFVKLGQIARMLGFYK